MNDKHAPPAGLRDAGSRLWAATTGEFELAEHELALLVQACRTADALDALQAVLDADGPVVESPQGRKVNPALPELRQQRIAFARLLAQLGLPAGVEGDDQQRPPGGSRGVYQLHPAS